MYIYKYVHVKSFTVGVFAYPLFRDEEIDFEFTIANDRWSVVIIEANTILSAKNWPILYTWQPNKWWDGYDHCARKLCNLSLYEEEIDNKSRSCSMEHCCSLVTLPNRRWHTIQVIHKDYWKYRLQERKNETRVTKYFYFKKFYTYNGQNFRKRIEKLSEEIDRKTRWWVN